jgi:N-acetylmuramoyl-L-alanine amidase
VRIISRAEWGAKHGNGNDVTSKLPWGEVVIHTEAGAQRSPATEATEKGWVRNIEAFHAGPSRGWNGIAYSFLVAPSGRIFEGRGWGRSGAHTENRNSTAAGVCFLGHGDKWPATDAQWAAARWLIGEGVTLNKLKPSPAIGTHAKYSTKGKTCPGTLIAPHVVARLGGITGHQAAAGTGLTYGDRGEGVKMLQGMLNILAGHRIGATGQPGRLIAVHGTYDNDTRAAVGEFQRFLIAMQQLSGQPVTHKIDGKATEAVLSAVAFWIPDALAKAP